jgi:RNA polymerase sigma factor (sigma-70 family)
MVDNELKTLRDECLAEECAKRPVNEQAWQEFWHRFYPLVHRKVTGFLRPFRDPPQVSDIDDVIQAIFLRLFTSLPKYDPQRSPLSAYVNLVATHCVMDYFRRRKARRVLMFSESELASAGLSTGEIEAEELWSSVIAVLRLIEPRKRRIIQAFLEADDKESICRRYGVTRSHLYTITYRFRQALRESLAKNENPLSDSSALGRI